MPRIHMLTGSGALCGALRVLESSSVQATVTCPQCLARLVKTAERREAFESFFPNARLVPGEGEPA